MPRFRIAAIGVAEVLLFSLVEGWRGRSWQGICHWTLRFRPVGVHPDGTMIRILRLRCAQPKDILEVHISHWQSLAFAMEFSQDNHGRMTSAGVVMLAMYGQDQQGCLCVPAKDFLWPVPVYGMEVQLKLRETPSMKVDSVFVSAEVD